MLGFARKAFLRTRHILYAFGILIPLLVLAYPVEPGQKQGSLPVVLFVPFAALILGAAALSEEREGGAMEFALSLPLSGAGLFGRLFVAGFLPLLFLAPLIVAEGCLLRQPLGGIVEWWDWLGFAALLLWPYAASFFAALIVDRFTTAIALGFVLITASELFAGLHAMDFSTRWLMFAAYAILASAWLFAARGPLDAPAHARRSAWVFTGLLLLIFLLSVGTQEWVMV